MRQHFWLLRATVEAKAPLAIGTGQGDDLRDALFASGHGGLPYLPGTSLAGVLSTRYRDAVQAVAGAGDAQESSQSIDAEVEAVFGAIGQEARASRLLVSIGLVHGADDRPVPVDAEPADDVLRACAAGVTRDHVLRDGYGVADGRGKFDESAVPVGARFTFELRLDAENADQAAADDEAVVPAILGALHELRLGGKSRRGFGRLTVVRAHARRFDLAKPGDRDAFIRLERDLSKVGAGPPAGFDDVASRVAPNASDGALRLAVALRARDHWLIGGGQPVKAANGAHRGRNDRPRHALPWSEHVILWKGKPDGQRGEFSPTPVPILPGTSVKGALRHRTLYHLRREAGPGAHRDTEAALARLFGRTKSHGDGGALGSERAGRVHIDDVVLDGSVWQKSGAFDHVSIDRYTGGAMPGLLYSEATLFETPIPLRIEIAPDRSHLVPAESGHDDDTALRRAFAWAVADLCAGRLPLGAKANAGHGTFIAESKSEVHAALDTLLRSEKEVAR